MRLLDPVRLDALHCTGLLDTPADETFDRFSRLACLSLNVPVALVSLVDADRQFLKSQVGLPEPWASERVIPHTLCAEIVETGERLVLRDVRKDPFRSVDEVSRALGVAGYAGIPLVTADGHVLGAFCAIDSEPHDWTEEEIEILVTIAAAVTARVQLVSSAQRTGRLVEDKQAILQSSLDCIVVMDHEGLVQEWNPSAERTFGWTREEALGRRLGELIVPVELRARHEEGLRRAATTGESRILGQRLRLPALRKDGSSITVELAITKVDREGHALFTGTIRDISEIVRAEEALQAAEERYRSLIENIPLVTYKNSAEEPFTSMYMSPQVESLLGYTPDEWAAMPELALAWIHPDDRVRVEALAREARNDGVPTRSEFRFIARDGRVVWVLDQTIPMCDEEGTILCHQGFLLDITEQKQLEEQLRQSQKMEAVGQLAGGIAHDFNNMLTAISGYAELLACSFDEGDPRAEDIDQVRKAAAHAAALTRQLLTFSRKQVLLPQRLDVNDVVRDLESMLARTIGAEV
ncbi:MAG: PAS domain S-box protein, partial [Actinomycetota bacterium]|nr:PAS domain S-box protein [Actinomycetota bacterium]